MKISTSWSQADWDNALDKVWKLSRDFKEILNFGLDHGYITSSDIIHASDIYKDPNKIYDEFEIEDFIKNVSFSDLMKIIQNQYCVDDIVDEMDKDEIMDAIGDDDLLSHIENSAIMDIHDSDIKEQVYHEYIDEWIEELNTNEKNYLENLQKENPDEVHKFICNLIGCGYADQNEFNKKINEFKNKLNKNSYNIKYKEEA